VSKHVSIKLSVIGLTLSALITAFVNPTELTAQRFDTFDTIASALTYDTLTTVPLTITPVVVVREVPRKVRSSFVTTKPYGPNLAVRPMFQVRATGYNSQAAQTDSTPFITATGATTQLGIIAVSRDLLADDIPYGSLVRLKDLGNYHDGRGYGKHQDFLDEQEIFIVEDTLHWRKENQIDVWFPELSQAREWGVRQVELELVRYGREGQSFDEVVVELPEDATFAPRFVARSQREAITFVAQVD
jgi:3D (Asp-Asp-Asp) domain-containing protein